MSVVSGQVIVPAGGTTLAQLPAGPASVVISNAGTAVIYVGAGTTVATASGMPVPSGGLFTFQLWAGSGGSALHAIATTGGSATAGFLITTSYGLPQPGQQ